MPLAISTDASTNQSGLHVDLGRPSMRSDMDRAMHIPRSLLQFVADCCPSTGCVDSLASVQRLRDTVSTFCCEISCLDAAAAFLIDAPHKSKCPLQLFDPYVRPLL